MKTKEELKALKEEVETLNKKLAELNEEELAQVSGGVLPFSDEPGLGLSCIVVGRILRFDEHDVEHIVSELPDAERSPGRPH